jgi:hypothetical protein
MVTPEGRKAGKAAIRGMGASVIAYKFRTNIKKITICSKFSTPNLLPESPA